MHPFFEGLTLKNEGNFNNLIGVPSGLFLLDRVIATDWFLKWA